MMIYIVMARGESTQVGYEEDPEDFAGDFMPLGAFSKKKEAEEFASRDDLDDTIVVPIPFTK